MPLDILDDKFTWNLGRISCVLCKDGKCNITFRYKGLRSKWDVEAPYPNERFAQVFTYTRQMRGFVTLLGSNKIEIGNKEGILVHVLPKNSDN